MAWASAALAFLLALAFALAPLIPFARYSRRAVQGAHDTWLRGMLGLSMLWLAWAEPLFVPMGLWWLWHWRGSGDAPIADGWRIVAEQMGGLLRWVAIVGTWFAVRAIPAGMLRWVVLAWLTWAGVQIGLVVFQWRWRRFLESGWHPSNFRTVLIRVAVALPTELREPRLPYGSFGQRTLCAGYLALMVPFAPFWAWPALGLGLWFTGPSWGALGALAGGLFLLGGYASMAVGGCVLLGALGLWWAPILLGRKLLEWTPRGDSLDSVRGRLETVWLMLRHWQAAGQGPGTTFLAVARWHAASGRRLPLDPSDHVHNDAVQLWWEYGWAGAATILLAAYRIGSGLHWADPWSAAAVIGAGLCLTSLPLRVAPLGLVILTIWGRVAP